MNSQISQEQIIISKKEVLSMQKAPRRMKKHYKKGTRLLYHNEVQMLGFTGATTVTPSAHEPRQSPNPACPGRFPPQNWQIFGSRWKNVYDKTRKLDVQLSSCMLQRTASQITCFADALRLASDNDDGLIVRLISLDISQRAKNPLRYHHNVVAVSRYRQPNTRFSRCTTRASALIAR